MTSKAFRSRILHVTATQPLTWEYLEDGVLLVEDGCVRDLGPAKRFAQSGFNLGLCQYEPDYLLVPGFIDTHVHSPQLDIIASYGEQLMEWLNRYTFPAEARYADEAFAATSAVAFLNSLLAAGTTTAMIFATSHFAATDLLFEAAHEKKLRIIAGKVLMDQNAMPALLDSAATGVEDSEKLINKWHGTGRLGYAITPRFAGSSTAEQLNLAGLLHRKYPDTWIQTHLSENLEEIAWVKSIHPDADDYLNTYEKYSLVNDRATFAHCIHLTDSETQRMAEQGGRIAFCPSSNLFLGSGLFDKARMQAAGIPVGIASDVGAGTSLSMLRTLGDAYKVCQLQRQPLAPMEALAMVTLGNAETLHLDHVIGNFAPGKEADFIMLDPHSSDICARRIGFTNNIEDEVFVYMTLGDERTVAHTYIGGEKVAV